MAVDATSSDPNVDITLEDEDGVKYGFVVVDARGRRNYRNISKFPIPRTPFKISAGEGKYSDFEFPFVQVAQGDWSGGSGQEGFENDRSRFRTSWALNTWMDGRVILGPREFYATGHRGLSQRLPGDMFFQDMIKGSLKTNYISRSFVPDANFTAAGISLWLRGEDGANDGATFPLPTITVQLRTDDGSGTKASDTILSSSTMTRLDYVDTEREYTSFLHDFLLDSPQALLSGTTYHVVVHGGDPLTTNNANGRWAAGVNIKSSSSSRISTTGTTSSWSTTGTGGTTGQLFDLYYRVWDAKNPFFAHLFRYKEAIYFFRDNDTLFPATQLFRNGYRGVATGTQSTTTLQDNTQSWANNELKDAILHLNDGAGKLQTRKIISNTSITMTVADWVTTPVAGDTEYVVQGLDSFEELIGHGITGPVVDVAVHNDAVLVSQGDDTFSKKFRTLVNATSVFEDLGTTVRTGRSLPITAGKTDARGNYWGRVMHPTRGRLSILTRGNRRIFGAKIVDWDDDWKFSFLTRIGGTQSRITGVSRLPHGHRPERLAVFKENGIWVGNTENFKKLPIDGLGHVRSPDNGRAHAVSGPYIYYSFLSGIERLHLESSNIDPLGPDLGSGLPIDRRGKIVDMLVYPGMIICAVDAGADAYSSVMVYNFKGWHTLYKSHVIGERIRKLKYQHIPTDEHPDRLWVSMGSDVLAFDFPSNGFDPQNDPNYRYTHEGVLDLSYMSGGLEDLNKHFVELGFFSKGLNNANLLVDPLNDRKLAMVHRQDSETSWITWGAPVASSNAAGGVVAFQTVSNEPLSAVTGFKNQSRVMFRSTEEANTMMLDALVQKHSAFVDEKFAWTFQVLVQDEGIDLLGDEGSVTSSATLSQLNAWAGTPKVLDFNHRFSSWVVPGSGLEKVYLSPPVLQPTRIVLDDGIEGYLAELTVTQV